MDGTPFGEANPFLNQLLKHAPGDSVTLVVRRGDNELQLKVTLAERPSLLTEAPGPLPPLPPFRERVWVGVAHRRTFDGPPRRC